MKHILILIIFLLSCAKEETQRCTPYNLVTESSEDSARQKCKGLAGSHPVFKVITSNYIGCLTPSEYQQAKKGESSVTKQYCSGVSYTIRVTLK